MLKLNHTHIDLNTVRIQSTRLLIRAINTSDTSDIFREFTPTVALLINPRPAASRSDTEAFIFNSLQQLRDRTALTTVILDKLTGEFLGCLGLHELHTPTPECGIWLKNGAQGMGYGLEAVRALVQWADAYLDFSYLLYPVDIRNLSSRKIPESLGGQIARHYTAFGGMGQELILAEYRIER